MKSGLGLDVFCKILRSSREVAFGSRLLLRSLGEAFLGLVHVLLGVLDLVCEGLLEHLVVLKGGGLSLASLVQLGLSFLGQALESADDAIGMSLVDSGGRGAHVRIRIGVCLGSL